jgi:hypothetical protein
MLTPSLDGSRMRFGSKNSGAKPKAGPRLTAEVADQFLLELAVTAATLLDRREIGVPGRSSVVRAVCKAAQRELSRSCGCKVAAKLALYDSRAGPQTGIAELSSPPHLPDHPPRHQYWKTHRRPNETPPQFVLRVYKRYLDRGMTRQQLRVLDETLAIKLYLFCGAHGEPPELADRLLTRRKRNSLLSKRFENSKSASARPLSRELRRHAAALERRGL